MKLGGATGTQSPSLLVSVFDGKAWSAFANIQLGVSTVGATFNPVLDLVVAAGATVKVTSLFKVAGTVSSSGGFYEIDLPNGDGTINLNGATNYFGSQSPGATLYDISSAQLGLLTYTAPAAGGTVTLQGTVYTGSAWTPWQNFELNIGVTVATALRDYANGQLGTAGTVADTAANVFANLNAMQSAFSSGNLTSIEVTNTTLQHEVLGHKQYTADHGLLSMLQGKVVVSQYDARDNVLNGGVSDLLLVNASGAFDTGQVGFHRHGRLPQLRHARHDLEVRRDGRLPRRRPRPVPGRQRQWRRRHWTGRSQPDGHPHELHHAQRVEHRRGRRLPGQGP